MPPELDVRVLRERAFTHGYCPVLIEQTIDAVRGRRRAMDDPTFKAQVDMLVQLVEFKRRQNEARQSVTTGP